MKKLFFCAIIVLLFGSNVNLLGLDAEKMTDYQRRLNDANPAIRLSAMDEIGKLAENSPEQVGNDIVPLLVQGLSDSDTKVRNSAMSDIAVISTQLHPRYSPVKPGMIDIRSYVPLKGALEKAMFDPDEEMRSSALNAYVLNFALTSVLQQKLIELFKTERGGNQAAIIEALTIDGTYNQPVTNFLLQLLGDHKYSIDVAAGLFNSPASPPMALLPKLVQLLLGASNTSDRQILASAVGKYGAKARPYLGEIEQLRNKETDAVTRANLSRAIEAVRTGKPLEK